MAVQHIKKTNLQRQKQKCYVPVPLAARPAGSTSEGFLRKAEIFQERKAFCAFLFDAKKLF